MFLSVARGGDLRKSTLKCTATPKAECPVTQWAVMTPHRHWEAPLPEYLYGDAKTMSDNARGGG